jgi:hypothetical protein
LYFHLLRKGPLLANVGIQRMTVASSQMVLHREPASTGIARNDCTHPVATAAAP